MSNVITLNQPQATMSSLDLLKVINQYRSEDGRSEMTHDNFIKKIEDELEDGAVEFHASYTTPQNREIALLKDLFLGYQWGKKLIFGADLGQL